MVPEKLRFQCFKKQSQLAGEKRDPLPSEPPRFDGLGGPRHRIDIERHHLKPRPELNYARATQTRDQYYKHVLP